MGCLAHTARGTNVTPAAPAVRQTSAPSSACVTPASSHAWQGVTSTSKVAFSRSHAPCARASAREQSTTDAPSRARSAAARIPTGPVPPRITARAPDRVTTPARRATAAAAVVLQPFASIIALTRNGPKKAF